MWMRGCARKRTEDLQVAARAALNKEDGIIERELIGSFIKISKLFEPVSSWQLIIVSIRCSFDKAKYIFAHLFQVWDRSHEKYKKVQPKFSWFMIWTWRMHIIGIWLFMKIVIIKSFSIHRFRETWTHRFSISSTYKLLFY